MKYNKIAIIGMGLIGGSIGKALIKKKLAKEVVGVCRRESSLKRAINEKALTKGFVDNYNEALAGAEIIFIATPVHTIKEVLEKLDKTPLFPGVIVTDAGSTKKEIVNFAAKFKDKFSFVGGHPLAGSEKTGVEFASASLFEGSLCVLTKDENTNTGTIEKVQKLWMDLGAEVDIVSPDEHDMILSFTSHLPHVVAYCLAGVQKKEFLKFASTGFKDTTRIASSDPILWSDIMMDNKENVLKSIEKLKEELSIIEKYIREGHKQDLIEKLAKYKDIRDELA